MSILEYCIGRCDGSGYSGDVSDVVMVVVMLSTEAHDVSTFNRCLSWSLMAKTYSVIYSLGMSERMSEWIEWIECER